MSSHVSTQELINRIEKNDRRYRRASTLLLIIIGFAIAATLILQYQALEAFKSQSAERAAGLKSLSEDQKAESEKTNRYLQCIARYFADPNRQDTIIADIESCSIDKTSGVVPGTDQTPLASGNPGNSSPSLTPGPAATGPNSTPVNPTPDPDTETDPNPAPPRGVIPRLLDGVTGLVNDARGILGL